MKAKGDPVDANVERLVAERTRELATANKALAGEIAELRQREAQRMLAESEAAFKLTVDTMPAMAWSALPDGSAEFFNQYYLDYLGFSAEKAQGWGWAAAAHPDDLEGLTQAWMRILASGEAGEAEARLQRFDSEYRWFLFRASPQRDSDGRIVKWHGVNVDIQDRKRAEAAFAESERDLRVMIDTVPAFVWSSRPNGSEYYYNRHYLDYLGLPLEANQGSNWTRHIHPDDLKENLQRWKAAEAAGTPAETESRLRRHDGVYRWFLFRVNPLKDEAGNIVKWYGVNTDIEDRKRAEEALKQVNDIFAEAQKLSQTGSFITDLTGEDHNWSDEACRIFGFSPGSTITVEGIRKAVHPDDLAAFDAATMRGISGENIILEYRVLAARGETKYVRVAAHAVERDGRHLLVGALQDVTDQKRAEAALDKARAELAYASRAMSLGVLTASIAHEVNQPLSGIVTNASTCLRMLAADPPNLDGARETARRMIRDGNRASEVVARLRALFAKKEFSVGAVDLNEAAKEVLALSRQELQRQMILVLTHFDEKLRTVIGDRVQLQQVILNFLLNASDALRDVVDRTRQVCIETKGADDGTVQLSVRDTGIGISEESLGKLFEPFYSTKSEGMGIGLSISRTIIDRHNGRIWAAPNEGPGATFSFALPCELVAGRRDSGVGCESRGICLHCR